jgi:hypothetical protein
VKTHISFIKYVSLKDVRSPRNIVVVTKTAVIMVDAPEKSVQNIIDVTNMIFNAIHAGGVFKTR